MMTWTDLSKVGKKKEHKFYLIFHQSLILEQNRWTQETTAKGFYKQIFHANNGMPEVPLLYLLRNKIQLKLEA